MNGLTNVWQLSGNVGRIEGRTIKNDIRLVELSLAVSRSWKDKDGEYQKETSWFKAKAFGKLAERIEQRVSKGARIVLAGSARIDEYQDKDGNKRTSFYMMVDSFDMLVPYSQLKTSGVTQSLSNEMDAKGAEQNLKDTFGLEPEPVTADDDMPF